MSKILQTPKFRMIISTLLFITLHVNAQAQTKLIGNNPRSGSINNGFSVVKGNQVAIKMRTGRKTEQLLQLNFGAENNYRDSLTFKVNIYEFNDVAPGKNLVKETIQGSIPTGKHRITINLEPYHIHARKNVLVAIEWLKTVNDANPQFATGLFNGGTYYYEKDKWKKIPIAGADFNLLVKKIKENG